MKKIIIIGVFFALSSFACSYGQDTISERDTCYIFWPHSNTFWLNEPNHISTRNTFDNVFWENIATSGTKIYGVSLRGYWPLDSAINVSLAVRESESCYIFYDTVWLDSSVVNRYFTFRAVNSRSDGPFDCGENCTEIYFHRPWPVPDTFYVVIRYGDYYNFDRTTPERYGRKEIMQRYDTIWPQRYGITDGDGGPDIFFPPYDQPFDISTVYDLVWGDEFPILEPNRTRCRKPTGLHLAERGDRWVSLCWSSGSGDSYRVTLEGPDDTIVMMTYDTIIRLDSLMLDANYWVEVQSLCRYQYHYYDSTILNPGKARMGFRTFGNGVTGMDADPQVTFYPNPARNHIVLETESEFPIRVTLADLNGREITSFDFYSATIYDVSQLPSGQYFLRLTTPLGTTTKKLIVQ